jgi:glucose/arabinose dehydrogenase
MMIAVPGDGTGRMFVVDQTGVVRIITADGKLLDEPFLDVRDRLVKLNPAYDERGLLSIAFHPEYRNNGCVYAYYSAPLRAGAPSGWDCTNRLSEFKVMADNPNKADMDSEKILLEIDKPYQNHNGGQILFGPDDGYLYLPLGDGGRADDTGTGHTPRIGNAQDRTKLLGKIIWIDIDTPGSGGKMYAIPPDNPFAAGAGVAPEIFAMGFRNPAYASFDSGQGHHLITADAGQRLFESAFIVTKGGNYGWNIREGTHCFDPGNDAVPPASCPTTGYAGESLIGPIVEIGHDVGNAIVGGYVYRGDLMPELKGKYIFGDWTNGGSTTGNGALLVATPPPGYDISMYPDSSDQVTLHDNRMWTTQEFWIANNPNRRVNAFVRGFGEDANHEIHVLTSHRGGPDTAPATGEVWKLGPASQVLPRADSGTDM